MLNELDNQSEKAVTEADGVRNHLAVSYALESADVDAVLAVYTSTIEQIINRFQKALLEQNSAEASCQAHALKGTLLTLGLTIQAETASELEKSFLMTENNDNTIKANELLESIQMILDGFVSTGEQI